MNQPHTHRFALPLLVGLLLMLVFSGCAASAAGSGGQPSSNSSPANAPTLQPTKPPITNLSDYCNLLSVAEVAQVTGLSVTGEPTKLVNPGSNEVICGYEVGTSTAGANIIFVISTDSGKAQTVFNASKQQATSKGATVANLSGLGDSAAAIMDKGVDSVLVLKGSVVFFTGGTTAYPLSLNIDQSLAQAVVGKL